MGIAAKGSPSALEGLRYARRRIQGMSGAQDVTRSTPVSLMDDYRSIREALKDEGLWPADALVMVAKGGNRAIFDAQGTTVSSQLFDRVEEPYALFSHGDYSLRYAAEGRPLRASTDDMAQLFGAQVPCGEAPWGHPVAFLLKGQGFLVTGRYVGELVAAAILIEKACRIELLAPRVGQVRYLNPALCLAEHAVYRASYSKHEREASDGR